MKNLFKLSLLALMSVALFVACSKDDNEYQEPQLDVTPNNIAGCWMLESYDNGQTLADGSYVYIDFVRADRSYTLYQNVDSALSRAITVRCGVLNCFASLPSIFPAFSIERASPTIVTRSPS